MDGQETKEFVEVFTEEQSKRIREEFSRLKNTCYLDQIGSALYPRSLIDKCFNDLNEVVYGNPHSGSNVGHYCTDTVDQARFRILQHFNANSDEYSVVFTSGATQALKLVAECFSFSSDKESKPGHFVYLEDNHTSVLGMRDVVTDRGAVVTCLDHETACELLTRDTSLNKKRQEESLPNSLFVYSAQCNFSGVKYPLNWIQKVHDGVLEKVCQNRSHWYCLLDAATFVSTNLLDLSRDKPDFICLSFYKIFGYPTGLGALLVKNSSGGVLLRKYYGGGTVLMALSMRSFHVPRPVLHDRFEDGTCNFLAISSLNQAFPVLYDLVGSMNNVSRHSFNLTAYTFYKLLKLHHSNGRPAVQLYADSAYDDIQTQGNVVNFNMLRSNGEFIGCAEVLHMANLHGIQLRTGCFCNPGACKRHLGLSVEDLMRHFEAGHVCGDDHDLVDGQPTGSVRVSFGFYNTRRDVDRLLYMLETCFVTGPRLVQTPVYWKSLRVCLKRKFELSERIEPEEMVPEMLETRVESLATEMNGFHVPTNDTSQEVYLSHIFVYPIKSCGRFEVSKWILDSKGLKYDRQWMITDSSGVALTQKRETKMSMIRPVVNLGTNSLDLTFEGLEKICVPLSVEAGGPLVGRQCDSKICGDRIRGVDCGDAVSRWLSSALNRPGLRLIRQLPTDNARSNGARGALSLANQAQYLMINTTSVKWLADQLDENSDCSKESMIDRFRSNFVVDGLDEAFVEQSWTGVAVGSVHFNVDGPCSRCQMICIDQNTGEKAKDPLTLLSATQKGKLKFGIYLSKATIGDVQVFVGDKVSYMCES